MDFKKNGASLSNILETGTNSISTNPGFSPAISKRTTSTSNSKPEPTNYLIGGVDIADTATAKHIIANATSTHTKPTGATKLRYMIIGGGGGGGGGCGGGYNNDDGAQDHALLGHNGGQGGYGTVKTGEISVTTYTAVYVSIGNGGAGGTGGGATYTTTKNVEQLIAGGNGGNGNSTVLKGIDSNNTLFTRATAPGGPGGPGGPNTDRYVVEEYSGHGSSWDGWENSTVSNRVTNGSGSGNTVYGVSPRNGNYNGNEILTTHAPQNNTFPLGWEDTLTQISSSYQARSNGGDGGWGYGDGKNANGGKNGNAGAKGRACLIWLY